MKKAQEALNRKQENKALLEKEMELVAGKPASVTQKVTQAEIFAHQDRLRQERLKEEEKSRRKLF